MEVIKSVNLGDVFIIFVIDGDNVEEINFGVINVYGGFDMKESFIVVVRVKSKNLELIKMVGGLVLLNS